MYICIGSDEKYSIQGYTMKSGGFHGEIWQISCMKSGGFHAMVKSGGFHGEIWQISCNGEIWWIS